jgi:hypothetical protein
MIIIAIPYLLELLFEGLRARDPVWNRKIPLLGGGSRDKVKCDREMVRRVKASRAAV